MKEFQKHLEEILPEKDSLKLVKREAEGYEKEHSPEACFSMGVELYQSNNFQIQEVGVLLLGYSAGGDSRALAFLRDTVSEHQSWKVQEVLAMAFDTYCKRIGYEEALPQIKAWLSSDRANVRRAVSEGLRIWTSRPYFREHPEEAIQLLSAQREDESEFVRRSAGNALRDIGKKHPQLLLEALHSWTLSSKEEKQVYRLASKYLLI